MARLTKGNQIILIVSTTPVNRNDMVNLIDRNIPAGFKALLTERMLGNI